MIDRLIQNAPEEVVTNGQMNYGNYNSPFRKVNLLDATIVPSLFKDLQLREWQAFQILGPGCFVFMSIYDTKKVSIVQCITYDLNTGEKHKFERKLLPGVVQLPNGLYGTKAEYRTTDVLMRVDHDLDEDLLQIEVDIREGKNRPCISMSLTANHDVEYYQPMVTVMPLKGNRGIYTHKAMLPVEGTLEVEGRLYNLEEDVSSLIIDDHKGFYPYITKYDWVTGLGFLTEGERFGFNLTDNQVIDQEQYNENCVWLDGVLHPLPPVEFKRSKGKLGSWYIYDQEGRVDLTFKPSINNEVKTNLLLMESRYEGPYGYFSGSFTLADGQTIPFENIFGVGEKFYLRG
ncbi:MAG: DUF2804 domain-containing protein [Bacteroidota bacterium]